MIIDETESPYDLGWRHGYDDLQPNCPYPEGSEEYKEYYEGYDQGSRDC